jgi:hypothetical protein
VIPRRALGAPILLSSLLVAQAPLAVERFTRPGPLAGVVARVNLRDPRVQVQVLLAQPAGEAKDCVGRLQVPSAVARAQDLALTLNGSYFRAEPVGERRQPYVVGNCGVPVGWHVSQGVVRARPTDPRMKATLVVRAGGAVSLHAALEAMPADATYAVSGSAMVLNEGVVIAPGREPVRHPRSCVGIDKAGATLFLVAVDGRRGHSRGATLSELGELMKSLGAHQAINLDGGGSSALVVKDPTSGAYTVANQPSESSETLPGLPVERPVVDVLGVRLSGDRPPVR